MKKIVLTIVAFMGCTISFGQLRYGIKAGMNYADYIYEDTPSAETSAVFGLHIGGFLEYPMSEKISLQGDLQFSQQGAEGKDKVYTSSTAYYTLTSKYKTNYLIAPLVLKYYINEKINLYAGGQLGFLMSAELTQSAEGESKTTDAAKAFETVDYGLKIGGELFLTENLFGGLGYYYGLSYLPKNGNHIIKNSVMNFTLGYRFNQ